MKRIFTPTAYFAGIVAAGLFLSSCGKDDDDEPVANAKISVGIDEATAYENDGTVEYTFKLDKPALEDFTLSLDLKGTATNKTDVSATNPFADYEIVGGKKEIDFNKGDTEGKLSIKLYSDYYYEDAETIEISIDDVDSDLIDVSNKDEMTVNLLQEDGMRIILTWGKSDAFPDYPTYTDVDMDLFLWVAVSETNVKIVAGSLNTGTQAPEDLFLPYVASSATYALSANYFEGTANPMKFAIGFIIYENGEFADEALAIKEGEYTTANINPWLVDANTAPQNLQIELAFNKTGEKVYEDFTDIDIPDQYSRKRTLHTTTIFQRGKH